MDKNKLKIVEPCTEDWEGMKGEGFKRFCDKCEKHVHDLSDLTKEQAKALLKENAGANICVVYKFNASGRIKFRERTYPRATRGQLTGIKKLVAAAALVPILAGLPACNQTVEPETVIVDEQPCGYASNQTYTPLDAILEAEQRLLQDLRDFLGFEPEIEMLAGEPMIDPDWDPQPDPDIDIVEIPEPIEPHVVIEPTEIVMGDIAVEPELDPEPIPEPAPELIKPEIKRMGKIRIPREDLDF